MTLAGILFQASKTILRDREKIDQQGLRREVLFIDICRISNPCDEFLRFGVVEDQGAIARLGHVTPARLSQIMGLLMLAPDIQEAILMLPRVHEGRDTVTERDLRRITRSLDWSVQRVLWSERAMRFSRY